MSGGKKFKLGRHSLAKELAASLILVIILFEGVLLAIVYNHQSRALLTELRKKADDYAQNLKEVLVVPIWDFDDVQIARIGAGFLQNNAVDEIRIWDPRGKMLFEARKNKAGTDRIRRSIKIRHKDQFIGRADIFFSLDAYTRDLAWLRKAIVLVLVGSLVVVFITTGILLRVFMRKPLDILQKGIDRVAEGEYAYGFDEIHHLELSGIAGRFKQMAAEIQAREKSLQVINRELQEEITERKRAEQRIRESEAKSRALLDAMPDMVFQLDAEGTFLDYQGARQDLVLMPRDFLGKKIADVLPEKIDTLFREKSAQALQTGRVQIFEYALPAAGHPAYWECRLVAVSGGTLMALVRNITGRKQAAVEKARLEEQLRQAQKMEAIGTLAGGVAHDLNNVLSGLVSYPELILLDLPPDSPLRDSILTIQKSGERAANIVQDLLTLARRGVSVSEVVDLNQVIRDYLESPEYEKLRQRHPAIRLETDLEPDLLKIAGSPVHLTKTVMNLVSNAAEAMPAGGGISIVSANCYVDKPVRGYDDIQEGDYVTLTVADTGIGIAAQDIERIFEPFYTKKAMGRSGTGLGMAVVWGTVKDHNGYIDVQSLEGAGTTFTIYLPASREVASPKTAARGIENYAGRGEMILVVDDICEQREIACGILKKLGYRVAAVASGEAALDYLKNRAVDLVVLDMIMDPGIDGLETFRRILKQHPGQKALITSGFSESDRVKEAQNLGAGAYVKKPYLLEKVAAAVRQELDG